VAVPPPTATKASSRRSPAERAASAIFSTADSDFDASPSSISKSRSSAPESAARIASEAALADGGANSRKRPDGETR
jgi:hypothetical protein